MIEVPREETPTALVHPEWVGGRRLWMESGVMEVIRKIREGDPVRGWEGDPRLAVYWTDGGWELCRFEHDGEYRLVARSRPDVPLDERLIDLLVANDRQRNTVPLHDRIVATNDRKEADDTQHWHDYVAEEAAPRLAKALKEEDGW